MKTWYYLLFLTIGVSSFGAVPNIRPSTVLNTMAEISNFRPRYNETVRIMGRVTPGDMPPMDLVYDPTDNTTPTNAIFIFAPPSGIGRLKGRWDGDVRSAGVVGDGVTDDQPVLQAALDTATSHSLPLILTDQTRYMLRAPLVLKSNAKLIGRGVLIKGFSSIRPFGAVMNEGADAPNWGEPIVIGATNIYVESVEVVGHPDFIGPLFMFDSYDGLTLRGIVATGHTNQSNFAVTLGGHNTVATGGRVWSPGRIFNDGVHILRGTNGVLSGWTIVAGDDIIPVSNGQNQSIKDWAISDIVGTSSHGYGMKITLNTNSVLYPPEQPDITATIENISFKGLHMTSGALRSGLGWITEDWKREFAATGPGQIRNITISDSTFVGGQAGDHDGLNPYGMRQVGCRNVTYDNVTVINSQRSGFSIHGATDTTINSCYVYPPQLDGYHAIEGPIQFPELYNVGLSILGGTYAVSSTNTTCIRIQNTSNLLIMGVTTILGGNAISAVGSTNVIVIGNHILNAFTGINTVGAGLIASHGNQFVGVTNQYSGTPENSVRLDTYLEVNRSDLGPHIRGVRGATDWEIGVIGTRARFLSSAGLHLSNTDGDAVGKLGEIAMYKYDTVQDLATPVTNIVDGVTNIVTTTNMPAVQLIRGSTTELLNTLNIGGGSSTKVAATDIRLWLGTNVDHLTGNNTFSLALGGGIITDGAEPPNADATLLFAFASTNKPIGLPRVLDAQRITPSREGAIQFNDSIDRTETYQGGDWRSMAPHTIPIVHPLAINLAANSTYYGGLGGQVGFQLSQTPVIVPIMRPTKITGYFLRTRSSAPGSSEDLVVDVLVDGVAVGPTTNTITGAGTVYSDFTKYGLTNISYTNVVIRLRTPNPYVTPASNVTASGYFFAE